MPEEFEFGITAKDSVLYDLFQGKRNIFKEYLVVSLFMFVIYDDTTSMVYKKHRQIRYSPVS